jgi:UDP-N-acetylmuramate--alanine ligase
MKIHFIGIGGIGVSALARYYLEKGSIVSGSDLVNSEIVQELREEGIEIKIGAHKKENINRKTNLVIYSPAVQFNNPELIQARKYKIKTLSYPQALGELTKKYFTIAVSGTHGKSTTTAMIALILIKAGFDPTVIIGTKLKEFKDSNFRMGKSNFLLIEADEWRAAFLNYWPRIIVLTNIEREHLDFYRNLNHILRTYQKYISHLPKKGILIANKDDKNIKKTFSPIKERLCFFYSTKNKNNKDVKLLKKILKIPGDHNISNALAALTLARVLKIPDKISLKALSQYKGAWRRFEEKNLRVGRIKLKVVSDYGHHPTEIKTTIQAAKEKYPTKKIWLVFQPHQYQRTYYLFKDFVKTFKKLAIYKIIITDIFDVSGREEREIKKKVSAEKLVKSINKKKVIYLPKEKVINYLKRNLREENVVIIMGAGDVYRLVNQFVF